MELPGFSGVEVSMPVDAEGEHPLLIIKQTTRGFSDGVINHPTATIEIPRYALAEFQGMIEEADDTYDQRRIHVREGRQDNGDETP